jgi:hypothetical protein
LQDSESNRRYEVELQLGKTDESHIIRTLEYWDIERKRYPQYDHVAVIVAEEITSRFLNVIGLFNGNIPFIAVQMHAYRQSDNISLLFTTVLSELHRGTDDEDETVEPTDRYYWEARSSKQILEMTDGLFALVKKIDPAFELKYNKHYIGLAQAGRPNNFVTFKPKREYVVVEIRLERSEEVQQKLEGAGIDLMDYDVRHGRYRLRLTRSEGQKHELLMSDLIMSSYKQAAG